MKMMKARERLELMDALQYPKLQPKDKKQKHRQLYKQAFPDNFKNRVVKTTDLELI